MCKTRNVIRILKAAHSNAETCSGLKFSTFKIGHSNKWTSMEPYQSVVEDGGKIGLSDTAVMDMMISTVQQQRRVTEQLRREAAVKRMPVSQAVNDIIKYINEHQQDDCLLVGFSSQKANPFREKSSCILLGRRKWQDKDYEHTPEWEGTHSEDSKDLWYFETRMQENEASMMA
ncbi:hypothetical protein B566_EDAN010577 [Ephemera danica]|nr:hypothetical protein B566_EDAN010577 [Ephemera danica]